MIADLLTEQQNVTAWPLCKKSITPTKLRRGHPKAILHGFVASEVCTVVFR